MSQPHGRDSEARSRICTLQQTRANRIVVTIAINTVWKGAPQGQVDVIAQNPATDMCGTYFVPGKSYLLYAKELCVGEPDGEPAVGHPASGREVLLRAGACGVGKLQRAPLERGKGRRHRGRQVKHAVRPEERGDRIQLHRQWRRLRGQLR